jgi:DNA-binding response OmpR family regulator
MKRDIKLLLVEDECTLAGIIKDTLSEKGFEVFLAYNGRAGIEQAEKNLPDIIISDIMMPKMDGFSFVKELKHRTALKEIPVIFLSARSQVEDVVEGFEIGADDYLKKPFAMGELIVRVRSLLRRRLGEIDSKNDEVTVYKIGKYTFDVARQSLSFDTSRLLSARESEVLLHLCRKKGEVVSNHEMLLEIWGSDTYFNTRSLNVFITKLRSHLSSDAEVTIKNVRGVGYILQY